MTARILLVEDAPDVQLIAADRERLLARVWHDQPSIGPILTVGGEGYTCEA